MPSFEVHVDIAAPPERVWAILADLPGWPGWTASMETVEPLRPGGLQPGLPVRIKQPSMPAMVWEVTEVDAGRLFRWHAKTPGITSLATHVVEPGAAEGTTRVTLRVDQTGALAWLAALLLGGRGKRYVRMEADGLKARAEQPSEPAG